MSGFFWLFKNTPPPRSLTGFIREGEAKAGGLGRFLFIPFISVPYVIISNHHRTPLPGTATSALGS